MNQDFLEIVRTTLPLFIIVACSSFYFGNKISGKLRTNIIRITEVGFVISILSLAAGGLFIDMQLTTIKYIAYFALTTVTMGFVLSKFCE
ncbi:hypothetical protein [Enterocloster citroniae]